MLIEEVYRSNSSRSALLRIASICSIIKNTKQPLNEQDSTKSNDQK